MYITLLGGLDYNRRESEINNSQPLVPVSQLGIALPGDFYRQFHIFNIFNPVYGNSFNGFTPLSENDLVDTQVGLYVQDVISLSEQWKLALGLRVDRFDRDASNTSFLQSLPGALSLVGLSRGVSRQDLSQDAIYETSPNTGVVFKPVDNISLYASYSEAFQPNSQTVNTVTLQTSNIDPSTSEQYEIGFKGDFLNERLSVNVAYFDITRSNVPAGSDPTTGVTLVNGEKTSRGLELDSSARFANGINVLFSYAYIDSEITCGENAGNRVFGVPRHSASLWGSYEFTKGAWKGFGFGGGAVYQGERFGDSGNTFELDSYTTFDATAFYAIPISQDKQLTLQFGVKNLTDKRFFTAGSGPLDIGIGAPRTFFGSIGFEF